MDNDGKSRGYGFVRFKDEADQQRALIDMQHFTGLGKKPIKVSMATPKRLVCLLSLSRNLNTFMMALDINLFQCVRVERVILRPKIAVSKKTGVILRTIKT